MQAQGSLKMLQLKGLFLSWRMLTSHNATKLSIAILKQSWRLIKGHQDNGRHIAKEERGTDIAPTQIDFFSINCPHFSG